MDAFRTARRAPGSARREEDRIQSAAAFAQRRSAAVSDRDEGWKSAECAYSSHFLRRDGERRVARVANSKGVRPLPWHGGCAGEKAMGSISRMRLSMFHLPSALLRVLRRSRSCARLFLYNEEMAFMATAGGSGCFYARAARRKPAKRRLITQKCVAHGGMEKR